MIGAHKTIAGPRQRAVRDSVLPLPSRRGPPRRVTEAQAAPAKFVEQLFGSRSGVGFQEMDQLTPKDHRSLSNLRRRFYLGRGLVLGGTVLLPCPSEGRVASQKGAGV